ncbi:MAG: Rho-binding antiterminator, partial [Pararheinheimera sp.]|nr:Rho-binding antiterminator [Rheinheimera sp.]
GCELHDHVEIICMRRYPVLIHQLDGSTIQGIARDTRSSEQQEFLVLDKDGEKLEIPLLQIERVEVLDASAPQKEIWLRQGGSCAI